MAQVVEHVLGKDEVTSSNLVSSSKKSALNPDIMGFKALFYFLPKWCQCGTFHGFTSLHFGIDNYAYV